MWIFILSRLYSMILRYRWTCSLHVPLLRSLHPYQLTTLPLLLMTRKLALLSTKAMYNMLNIRLYHPTDESYVANEDEHAEPEANVRQGVTNHWTGTLDWTTGLCFLQILRLFFWIFHILRLFLQHIVILSFLIESYRTLSACY